MSLWTLRAPGVSKVARRVVSEWVLRHGGIVVEGKIRIVCSIQELYQLRPLSTPVGLLLN